MTTRLDIREENIKKEIEEKNTISMSPKDLIGKIGLINRLKYKFYKQIKNR